jgi:hypothetical protein
MNVKYFGMEQNEQRDAEDSHNRELVISAATVVLKLLVQRVTRVGRLLGQHGLVVARPECT